MSIEKMHNYLNCYLIPVAAEQNNLKGRVKNKEVKQLNELIHLLESKNEDSEIKEFMCDCTFIFQCQLRKCTTT
jgi:hypothetical protein